MTLFLHLLRHDLRTHRTLLLVWLAVLALHPVSGLLLQWVEPTVPSAYITTAVLVTLARVASIAIIVGVLIQTDGPSIDTAFWRTRPVPARLLAAQKLALVYSLFLLLPAAMVIATAVVAGAPAGDLGWMLRQVLVADALFVGACVVAAAATTRPSTTLLTLLLGAIAVWFGSIGIGEVTRLLGVGGSVPLKSMTAPAVGFTVLSAIGLLLAAVAWRLYVVGLAGRIHVTGAAVVIVVLFGIAGHVVVPARGARPEDADGAIQLTLDVSRLRTDTVEREGVTQVLVSAPPSVSALRSDERAQVWPHDATLRTPNGEAIVARTDNAVRAGTATDTGLDRWPALAVLAPDRAAALQGVPLDYTGSFTVEVLRREPLGRTRFVPGGHLAAGPYRLRIDALRTADSSAELALADVTVLRLTPWFPGYTWNRPEWSLVDRSSGRRVPLFLTSAPLPPSLETLLPTFAPPFIWATMEFRRGSGIRPPSGGPIDGDLELLGIGLQRYLRRDVAIQGLQIP